MILEELIKEYGDENENWLILEFLTKKSIPELKFFKKLSVDDIYNDFIEIKNKRKQNYPLQYIFGKWEFYGLELNVNESALIPRFETEILVDEIIKLNLDFKKILDIGSGSGAITLALANNFPNSFVLGADISEKAVKLALENKKKLGFENCDFIISDLYENIKEKFDLIVSNPPYIDENDMKTLEKELSFEPQNALYGGVDGLDFYRNIISEANKFLNDSGIIAFEIGYNQRESVSKLLIENGFNLILTKKDFADFDRIIIAQRGKI